MDYGSVNTVPGCIGHDQSIQAEKSERAQTLLKDTGITMWSRYGLQNERDRAVQWNMYMLHSFTPSYVHWI